MTQQSDASTDPVAIAVRAALAGLAGNPTLGAVRHTPTGVALVIDAGASPRADHPAIEARVLAAAREAGASHPRVALTAERSAGVPASAPSAAPEAPRPGPRLLPKLLVVGSGKGGVGKSTVSANLAVALAQRGWRIGVVDADIYGPSQARLFGTEGERPQARDSRMIPVPSAFGVPLLSMAHLVAAGQAIAWRGPMAGNALGQLLDADWATCDWLVVDLPPGTGDIQLTMLQRYRPTAAVIVSTPQDLALIDARRALGLFEQGQVPVLGLVENMAGYVCPHCGGPSDPFGSGGAEAAAAERGLPLLARIPLDAGLRAASDAGTPPAAALADDAVGTAFAALAAAVAARLAALA